MNNIVIQAEEELLNDFKRNVINGIKYQKQLIAGHEVSIKNANNYISALANAFENSDFSIFTTSPVVNSYNMVGNAVGKASY